MKTAAQGCWACDGDGETLPQESSTVSIIEAVEQRRSWDSEATEVRWTVD